MREAPCQGVDDAVPAPQVVSLPAANAPSVKQPRTTGQVAQAPAELETAEPVVMETKPVAVKVEAEAAETVTEAELDAETATPIPNPIEPLTHVPGVVGDLVDWIPAGCNTSLATPASPTRCATPPCRQSRSRISGGAAERARAPLWAAARLSTKD
jgi:hypothetical protein